MKTITPFYDPLLSYDDNYNQGPFGSFAEVSSHVLPIAPKHDFFGIPITTPFGIPAGPLLNSAFTTAAFYHNFDICIYKTVRTVAQKSHPLPNVLSIDVEDYISSKLETVVADYDYNRNPLSITNSFGVPSFAPDIWQPDMHLAVKNAGKNQVLVGSFQGTHSDKTPIEDDYALAARLVAETGAPVLEANLSCPNEGVSNLLCFDLNAVERIANKIKEQVPDKPLLIKIAYFESDEVLANLVKRLHNVVDGISTINTLSATPVTREGKPALGENRPTGGVCGASIRWAGVEMVQRLVKLRNEMGLNFKIVGVGGIDSFASYQSYIQAGADAALSATGAMWNPNLAIEIQNQLANK